jgi:WD40 repeat protein
VHVWDVHTGQELLALRPPSREVLSLSFSPDGRMLLGGGSRSLLLWDGR